MLFNYIHIALRSIQKSKIHTLVNVFGLAAGLACVFLIMLNLQVELSYDASPGKTTIRRRGRRIPWPRR
jgi:putative ABC transport system permease protein